MSSFPSAKASDAQTVEGQGGFGNAGNLLVRNAHLALRAAVAAVFVYHALTKFPVTPELAAFVSLPVLVVYVVAMTELAGAALLLAGGFGPAWVTRLGALVLAPVLVGILQFHWGQWSFVPSASHPIGGIEVPAILSAVVLYLGIRGNGV